MDKEYAKYAAEKAIELIKIDSPTGYTKNIIKQTKKEFEDLGFVAKQTNKGALIVEMGGEDSEDGAILFEAHVDTIGAMVKEIKSNGRLIITNLGGLVASNCETENVRIITRFSGEYDGTYQHNDPSVHVNRELRTSERSFDTMEVVIDEDVHCKEDTKKLGIDVGDFVCFDPRPVITKSGYIKSRFLDDKLALGIFVSLGKYLKDNKIKLKRKVYLLISIYEEVGHGGSSNIPSDASEVIAVDMGCVGLGIEGSERKVSICAKDSAGPYDFDITNNLILAAKKAKADYVIDCYPNYGSDAEAALKAGYDVKHGLLGPGVYASHGYERSHLDGVLNTLKVLKAYLDIE